jgi:hypothetical protein
MFGRRTMRARLDWWVGDEDGGWETISAVTRQSTLKIPWRALGATIVALVALSAVGYGLVRMQYRRALAEVAFQIQCAIDLETRALSQRDTNLYLAQQDGSLSGWSARQVVHARADESSNLEALGFGTVRDGAQDDDVPSPVKIREVALKGDTAWVQVIVAQEAMRQVRFYRRTDLGWKRTAPDAAFWGEPVELTYGQVVVRGHERDLPYVLPLAEHISQVHVDVCKVLNCAPDSVFRANIVVEMSADSLPSYREDILTLASPWLSGVPLKGTWDEATLDELAYWVIYATALREICPAPQSLHPLQKAVLVEYAALQVNQDTTQPPILRRIIERHGIDVLPEVLRSLQSPVSTSRFMALWLSISPSKGDIYFTTLADIAREAVSAGRQETAFLVDLLILENADRWMAWMERRKWASCHHCEAPRSYEEVQHITTKVGANEKVRTLP